MEHITLYIETILVRCGVDHNSLFLLSHILLAIVGILLSFGVGVLVSGVVVPMILKITSRTKVEWDDIVFNERVLKSLAHIIPAFIIWMFLPYVFSSMPIVKVVLERVTAIYITIMIVSTVITFINSLKRLSDEKRSTKIQYLHSFCGVLKIVMIFVAAIVVTSIIINKNPMVLFAGLGATSAILMLVFQDTIKGLVAGIRLTSNDMLHKGDWITVPKAGIDGNVEDMTLTTVKVRNFDNTIVTITPQTLVDESFQNWIGMQQSEGRRVKRKLYFDFNSIQILDEERCNAIRKAGFFSPDKPMPGMVNLTVFRAAMEEFLKNHELVNGNMLLMVRQLEPTNTGLPVEFYFFLKDKEWVAYEHNLAYIMEEILADIHIFGLKIYQYNGAAPLQ